VLEIICTDSPIESAPHPVLRLAESYINAGEPAMARQRLEEALQKITDTRPVRARLSVLYREAEAWGPLAELTAVEAAHTENTAQRTKLLREAADLHVTKRNDPQAAVPLLEQAAELTPDDRAIKLTLCDALSAAGRIEEASAVLRQIIDAYGARRPKDRAVVHHYLARVYLASGDRSSALSELDVALKIDPTHPEILLAVARLSFEEKQYDRSQRTYRSLLMMVRRLRDEQASPAVTRTEILFSLAEIADKQGEADRAVEHLESAFEAARENTEECDRLVRVLRGKPNHQNLARALELRMEISGNEPHLGTIAELATLYEQHLDKPVGALDLWLKTIDMRPSSGDAHRAAVALARRLGAIDRYVDTLRRRIDSTTNDPPLIDLLLHLGRALADGAEAEQADAMFARAEALLLKRPGDRRVHEVWRALEASSARRGDRAGQISILEKRIQAAAESAPATEVADGLYRLAELVLGDPEHTERSIDALERALGLDPQPDRAEAIFRRGLELGVSDVRLLEMFEKFARANDRPSALVDVLLRLGGQRGVSAYQEAYATAQNVGEAALIERVLRQAITKADDAALTPDDYWAVVALSAIRLTAEDFKDAASLEERAARISAPDAERGHLIAAATIAKDKLGDLATAARIYAELFEREPADREVWEPLVELYRRLGDDASLGKVLEQLISLLEAVEDRSRMRLELAALAQKNEGGDERAISVLAELLEDDPTNEQGSSLQATLLEKAGRLDELASLIERRIDAAKDRQDTGQVMALSTRLASLFEQQNDLDKARDAYFAVLDWDSANIDALRAIVRICEKRGELSDVADALEKLLGAEKGESAEKTALQLADVRTQQNDDDGVDKALEAGLRAFPASAVLGSKLKDRLLARSDFRKLAEIHVLEADNAPDAVQRVLGLRKAAAMLREKEQDLRGAIDILRRAIDIDSSDRSLVNEFVGAQAELGEHQVAVASIASIAANLEAGPAVDLMLNAARALIGSEGGGPAAVELVEEVRRRQPEAWDPVIVLAEAYVAAGRIDEARPLAANAVAAFEGRRSKTLAMAHHALAAVERASGNDADALVQFTKAFEVDPTNVDYAMELGQYAVDRGEADIAARALRVVTMAKASGSGVTSRHKAIAYYNLGRLAASQGDRGKARLLVDKALAEDATLEAARNLAAELAAG
jgi:tetratricopeptide (TPR) repeat protein